ncbi:MAG: hypothetical protein A2X36_11075 [Elusimicrobia bacterium GWA2_69_24]|nr:MAG: hypothetical protein A2X36_11075 [Elusimicrobia bacterium GWA2_69_24]HBL17359.1 hypothetical protein [Elusimicrobiota bacterium]
MTAAPSRAWIIPGAVFLYAVLLFGWMHRQGGLSEPEGYYHARVANLLPAHGLARTFEWTQASDWKDRWSDGDFLYHLLMAPFAQGAEPIRGALVLSTLLSAGVFLSFHLFLRGAGVPAAWLGTALLFCMGGPFLLRLSFVRPQILSVLCLIAALHFLVRKDWRALAAAGFLHSWSCGFPAAPLACVLAFAAGRRLAGGGGEALPLWRDPGAFLAGGLLGLVLHPYTPLSLDPLRFGALSLELSRGSASYSTLSFLMSYPLLNALLLLLGVAGWRAGRRASGETLGLLAAASAAYVMTLAFSRGVEYAAPLTAAALAFAWRDCLDADPVRAVRDWAARRNASLWTGMAGLVLVLAGVHVHSLAYVLSMDSPNGPPRFREAARWLAENLEPGETVVNLWGDDFPDLFYDGHRQRYLTGIDPAATLRWDPKAAMRLELMRAGRIPIDAAWLAETFRARVMVLRAARARFYPQLAPPAPGGAGGIGAALRGWRPVYIDEDAAVYALAGSGGPPPESQVLPTIPALPGARPARQQSGP